ncbi:MAG: P-loop NTPase fold protein, partial [Pseudomonadota bacterium]
DLIKGETDDTPNPELDPEPDPEPDPDPDPDPNFPIGQIATTLNDNAKGREDLLSVKEEAKAFARLIASTSFEPPLAIGVFGPWGSGKSFFMNQIEMEIDKLADPKFTGENGQPLQSKSDFHGKIVQIQFNAWHYMESNIWASLVDVIFKALDAWLRKENGGAQEGERVDALFDSLATAQEERLDAIEALAQKVSTLETARQNLSDIEEKTQNYWKAVLRKLTETALTNDDLQKAFDALGLHQLNSDVENLQAAITEARTAVSDADLLSRSLRSRVSSTGNLVGLAAVILLGPLLISGIISFAKTKGLLGPGSTLNINEVVTTLSALVASATGWVGFVTARAKSGVAALRKLQSNFDTIDAEREGAQKTYLEKLETDIEEAQSRISKTEEAVAKAQSRLMEKTSASRIAAFIRERAEGDVYSKHLGIIDTIRCDFEQLSDLIEHSKTGEEEEKKTLKRYQEHLAIQIDAIKTRYKLNKESKSPDASTDEPDAQADADEDLNYTDELRADPYARVRIAIETLEASSKEGVQLATAFDRIVLYIDDLDRCPPDKVYEVLQAVHLFLNFPLFMVVVGVDTRWIETSLKRELGDLVGEGSSVSPTDYLEKIFQIPYWIRQMEASSAQNFVKGILFEKDSRASEAQSDRDDFDDQSEDDEVGTEQFSPEAPPDSSSRPQAENVSTELPPESVQRHDQASDDQLPDGQDGTDSTEEDNDDAGGSRIFARPVEITADERAILEEFAPFAGQSPRKLLRFVNVYGLIKSVDQEDGSSLIDCTNDPVGCRALVAQLALATGEPTAAMTHFERITSSDACSDYFKPRQSVGPETELVPDFPPDISALIWKPLSLVLLSKERDEAALTELFDKLKLTAAVARRYTFASSDAVRSEAL